MVLPAKLPCRTSLAHLPYLCAAHSAPHPQALGTDAWVKDATLLAGLKPFAEDAAFRKR